MFQHWLAALCNQAAAQNSPPLHAADTQSSELVDLKQRMEDFLSSFSLSVESRTNMLK